VFQEDGVGRWRLLAKGKGARRATGRRSMARYQGRGAWRATRAEEHGELLGRSTASCRGGGLSVIFYELCYACMNYMCYFEFIRTYILC
jgi:hypothetical protein